MSQPADRRIRKTLSKTTEVLEDGLEDSFSRVFHAGQQEDLLYKYAGTAEQGDPTAHRCGWHLPQSGVLPAACHHLPDGICRGLVSVQSLHERRCCPTVTS